MASTKPSLTSLSPTPTEILSVGFNQDASLVTVGSSKGFRVYRAIPFKRCFQEIQGSIKIVEMLFSTSLVALVGAGKQPDFSPRRIRLYNTKIRSFICELDFTTTVLNVKMNHRRLVAVLESKIHIFDLETLKILHTLRTPPNPKGVVALSGNISNGYLALPGHDSKGEVLIYDVMNLQVQSSINACNNPVQILSMNDKGTLLAASSTMGTVIRVFSVPEGTKLHTFRRGSYPSTIHSIAFSHKSAYLAVSSSSRTIHVFELKEREKSSKKKNVKRTPMGDVASSATAMVTKAKICGYLPELLSDIVEPGRHFAFVNLKDSSQPTLVAFSQGKLLVLSAQGYFCRYSIPEKGGECKLEMEFSLIEKPDEEMEVKILGKGAAQTLFDVQYDKHANTADSKEGKDKTSNLLENFEISFSAQDDEDEEVDFEEDGLEPKT
mmetsp:Transcript_3416/g.8014  ORF Transcript_3416/g.8014 Transcript_3416/m.8014 type:complete len:437 (-) Transcript_3416:187-1497(-)|eukprot:CAMPEP_0114501908 /NCGR_PEP_ID=MMETSP0109-20121206/8759_1 /TAXON_ID=29199 /ORGANISM="Chlorarachnion reptans, Strain CCCM449" /LENGTH=436 /DNA_ID=CAMNT_0001679689 /DNA_START=293 /DNA_END=1603 /DNA_ORIENTATION=-